MNCYECAYFIVKIDNHLNEIPYCSRFNKSMPMSNFVYNFFCFDSDLPYRSERNEPRRNNRFVVEKHQQTIDNYGNIYDTRSQQTFNSKKSKISNKRWNGRQRTSFNKRKLSNVSLYDFK